MNKGGGTATPEINTTWSMLKSVEPAKSYEEIIDFIASGTTPESVIAFRPSEALQQRVTELMERAQDGTVSADESAELEACLHLEHIMVMAKARARQRTQFGR